MAWRRGMKNLIVALVWVDASHLPDGTQEMELLLVGNGVKYGSELKAVARKLYDLAVKLAPSPFKNNPEVTRKIIKYAWKK